MATLTALRAMRMIQKHEKAEIFYLFGSENALKQELTQQLKAQVLSGKQDALNFHSITIGEMSYDQLYQVCCTLPMFSPAKIVIVYEFDRVLKNKTLQKQWRELLENKPAQTIMILWGSKTPDRRLSLLKWLSKQGWVIECAPLNQKELHQWLRRNLKKEDLTMSQEAMQLLLQLGGTSLNGLRSELEKLISFCQGQKSITTKDIEQVVIPSIEANIFHYVDALGRRQAKIAWKSLNQMLISGEPPLRIFTMIVRQFRLLLQATLLQERSGGGYNISQVLKLPDFVVRKLMDQARFFSVKSLQDIFYELVEWEGRIKSGEIDAKMALELLTLKICIKK